MKKQSKNVLLATTLAKELQVQYDKLQAPWTQAVRNPYPMHVLVANALPSLPALDSKVSVLQQARLTVKGKDFWQVLPESSKPAREVFPLSLWQKNAVSGEEICDKLKAQGYIVKHNSISQALMRLKRDFNVPIQSVRCLTPDCYSYCRYFLAKS